jgi:hypothetical protein
VDASLPIAFEAVPPLLSPKSLITTSGMLPLIVGDLSKRDVEFNSGEFEDIIFLNFA